MKHYNFFLLTKRKQNGLIKAKAGIEDIEMRVIKWERVWNDMRERERERERNGWYLLQMQVRSSC